MTQTDEKKPPRAAPKKRRVPKRLKGLPSILEGLDVLLADAYGHVPRRRTLQYFGRPDRS